MRAVGEARERVVAGGGGGGPGLVAAGHGEGRHAGDAGEVLPLVRTERPVVPPDVDHADEASVDGLERLAPAPAQAGPGGDLEERVGWGGGLVLVGLSGAEGAVPGGLVLVVAQPD